MTFSTRDSIFSWCVLLLYCPCTLTIITKFSFVCDCSTRKRGLFLDFDFFVNFKSKHSWSICVVKLWFQRELYFFHFALLIIESVCRRFGTCGWSVRVRAGTDIIRQFRFRWEYFFICGNVQLSRPGQSMNCVGNTHKVAWWQIWVFLMVRITKLEIVPKSLVLNVIYVPKN